MEIDEFLLARIAEDEADAVKGAGFEAGRWSAGRDDAELKWYVRSENHGPLLSTGYVGNGDSGPYARHIARWDPARVVAECSAKRAVIAMGPSRCGGDWSDGEPPFPGASPHYPVRYLVGCDGCAAAELADFDRQAVLAHLAAVYADHPDFDPAWSVTADAR